MLVKAKLKRFLSTQRTHSGSRAGLSTPCILTCLLADVMDGPSFCMNFFSFPSSLHEFFFLAFSLAWIFFWFFPHPHPHHFSNGPSLSAENSTKTLASQANESEVGIYYLLTNLSLAVKPGYLCITKQTPTTMTINNTRATANTIIGITGNKS